MLPVLPLPFTHHPFAAQAACVNGAMEGTDGGYHDEIKGRIDGCTVTNLFQPYI